MAINCPSCGGKMHFDIPKQLLKCSFCDTEKTINEYKSKNEAETQQMTYDSVIFTCKNCGAELTAPDEQAVAYCSYCGSEQMMSAKHEALLRPKRIIPFQKSKLQAKNAYAAALKKKLYVPKEFKDPKFLEGFRGIYLPYYAYHAVVNEQQTSFSGHAAYTSGGYDYKEDYQVTADLGGTTRDINFDASSAFDDTLANEIAPFQDKDMKDFHEGYLAGFYADKATAAGGTYLDAVTDLAINDIYKEIERDVPRVTLDRSKDRREEKAKLGIGAIDCEVSYFPVWFLTWKHKNRVAYSVMNGQTGKITMDIPVNKKMFFLISLAAAVVIFAILTILPMFILPKGLCSIASVVMLTSTILLHRELKKIYERENHIYDYGDTQHESKKKAMKAKEAGAAQAAKKKTTKKKSGKAGWLGCAIPIAFVLLGIIASAVEGITAVSGILSESYILVFIIVLALQVLYSVFIIRNTVRISRKSALIPAILAPAVLVVGIVIAAMNSPYDYWYYGTALACLVGTIANCLSAINYFNYLTTRPVPNFFRREGANNAK